MASLLESYKNRLAISESVHQKSHMGQKMSAGKKLMIAQVLSNTSRFLNESFESASATQRSALGDYKRFCLNVSTIALPNLILPDLMMTQPMSSIAGYITYLRYTAGINKGGVKQGQMFNSVYRMGTVDEDRTQYTSSFISEKHSLKTNTESVVTDEAAEDVAVLKLDWAPVKSIKALQLTSGTNLDFVYLEDFPGYGSTIHTIKDIKAENIDGKRVVDRQTGIIVAANQAQVKVLYEYDNVVIPQSGIHQSSRTDIPTLTADLQHIDLHAHARRIAVYYSQIAAFQAKTDYGMDIGEQLATQAQGELAYEIDTEGVFMLFNGAEEDPELSSFQTYEKATGRVADDGSTGIQHLSRSQYYEGLAEVFARAKRIIYQRTQKFTPNYAIVGSNLITILPYLKGWTAAPASNINGPYFAGTWDGVKVYVSPALQGEDANAFVFGVNGSDLQTSAAVYAPYMAVVPTQLLGFADGTMTQGFSTMYDMKLLSTYNRNGNNIVEPADGEGGQYSWLLVKGRLDGDFNWTPNA